MASWVRKPSEGQAKHSAAVNELLHTVGALECSVQLLGRIPIGDATLHALLLVTVGQIERCRRTLVRLTE